MQVSDDKLLAAVRQAGGAGLALADLTDKLGVGIAAEAMLRKRLGTMVRDGTLRRLGRDRWAMPPEGRDQAEKGDGARVTRSVPASAPAGAQPFALGRIRVHPAGYGFVEREDGNEDVFVPAKYRGSALDGDRVRVYTWAGYKGTEGRVEEVLSRGRAKLTGVIRSAGRTVFLEPDDPRIASTYGHVTLESGAGAARLNDSVVVEITQYPSEARAELVGRVARVLGPPDDPRTEVEKVLVCADIPVEFPTEALAQAARTSQELGPADLADRIDLRDRPFLTIDPETARDFDDAICLEPRPGGGHRVWVAVADVSHYVRPDDALDREAQIRGCSVYLPDRAIPMLPRELSSGICSLNPEVDRCAMVVRLDLDATGVVRDRGFAAAVIRSQGRLDYPGVAAALTGDFRGRREMYRKWEGTLRELDALARVLRGRRMARGALDLELPEAKVLLDEDDPLLVRDVVQAKGSEDVKRAYQLVEEYMLAANEAVGGFFSERGAPTVWRVHAPPGEERLGELAEVLAGFGVDLDEAEAQTPRGMQRVLAQVAGLPAARALTFLVLRSLKQAVYAIENVGHFGLASPEYLHFTSPIRRYPDLLVHRLLKLYLHAEGQASGGAARMRLPTPADLQAMAASSSAHERRAAEAEREVVDMYRAYMMRDRLGEQFDGVVSAVTNFGVFVEVASPFIEGLIKLEALGDDFFEYDGKGMRMTGRTTGVTFSLGEAVKVEIVNISVGRRRIDFKLVGAPARRERGGGDGARPPRPIRGERRDRKERERTRRPPPRRGDKPRGRGR